MIIQKLNKEVKAGRMAGPFLDPPLACTVTNPLGLVPKMNEEGLDLPGLYLDQESSYHMITDLHRSRVNAGIPNEFTKVQYTRFDDVVEMCIKEGKGCFMAKLDIKSAYRNIPVHPDD